jgi:hypothetical protein
MSFLLMNWIPAIILGLLILRLARPYLSALERIGVAGLLVALGLFAPGRASLILPYSPPAVHALIFSLLSLHFLQRDAAGFIEALAAGGLAGLAFCSKQEIGLVALLAICVPVVVRSSRREKWLLGVAAGFLCVAGTGMLVALGSASLDSLRDDSHLWPIGKVPEPWKYLAMISTGILIRGWPARLGVAVLFFVFCAAIIGLLSLLAVGSTRYRRPLLLVSIVGLLISGAAGILLGWRPDPLYLSVLIAFAIVPLALLDRTRRDRDFLVAFSLFTGLVATRTAFGGRIGWSSYSGVTNVATSLTWALFLFCFLPRLWPGGKDAAVFARKTWGLIVLAVAAWGTWKGVRDLRVPSTVLVETSIGRVWVPESGAPMFVALGQNLKPGERALVLPEPNAVEALFKLQSASPLLYHMPGWLDARAEEQLLRRFASQSPDVVVLFGRTTWEFGVEPLGRGFGRRLIAWLDANYSVAANPMGGLILRRKQPI